MTDRQTHRHTDRQTPAILLSAPCYAIAMGQINSKCNKRKFITPVDGVLRHRKQQKMMIEV